MIAALLLACAVGEAAGYVDASLVFEGRLLGREFVDVDGDGGLDLVVALLGEDGRRRLQVHPPTDRGFAPNPAHDVSVHEDVIAYGFADVRDEPGREIVFLTRSGAYSYSLEKSGYRGNVERLVDAPLIYDVPSPRELPVWPYVLERDGGDLLILPGRGGFAVFGPRAEPPDDERTPRYELVQDFGGFRPPAREDAAGPATRRRQDDSSGDTARRAGPVEVVFEGPGDGPLLREAESAGSLLTDTKQYGAPALADVDGDGVRDLLVLGEDELRVHLATRDGFRDEPDRREPFPDYLVTDDERESLVLRLEDLDGDGDPDLLGTIEVVRDGFEDSDLRLLLLLNDGRRMLPSAPDQVLRIEAAVLRVDVVDVNGDGRPDLFLRKFNLPSMVETVTGLEFTMTYLLFLGEDARGRVVERRPAMRQKAVYDEESVSEVLKHRELKLDCDGDGRPDLVELDLQGRIAVRRLTFESGFFTGDRWELSDEPWRRFDVRGDIRELEVRDLNGDGLGDVISASESGLTLLVSRRGR